LNDLIIKRKVGILINFTDSQILSAMIALEQLKLLVNLSLADGEMSEKEKQYIKNIGRAHGFPESSVETLFYGAHEIIIPDGLTYDQRFDYAFSLVQLMMVDNTAFQPEIDFCKEVISKLGYKPEAVDLLFHALKNSASLPDDKEKLKKQVEPFMTHHEQE
jgi:uncharacterized tellurite resistance protein B-like protein